MELKGKKINFLGDSITQGVGASGIERRYTDVFARKTGAIVRNYGISGTRFARQTTPTVSNLSFDDCFIDRAGRMDRDADVVVVFGGTNDFGHGDASFGEFLSEDEYTFCGATNALFRLLIREFPDAEIIIMTPLHRGSESATTNEIGLPCRPLADYVAMEKRYAEYYSLPVLDLWSVSGIQPCDPVLKQRFAPDALHPNDRGHERLADRLMSFLKAL